MAKATLILHSGDLDKTYSAFIIGTGALAMGMKCSIFFTFWGLQRLKKGGLSNAKLSKMNFLGLGTWFMKRKMKKANVASLEQLLREYKDLGGKILACDMTMKVMGCSKEDLIPEVDEYASVANYINDAKDSDINLFI